MGKKIMIVDDDRVLLDELKDTLIKENYEVVAVNNPKKALQEAIKSKPDIVLVDIKMCGKNGFQVASDITYFSGLDDPSIFVMTGCLESRYDTLARLCGLKGLLRKPISYPDLISKIDSPRN